MFPKIHEFQAVFVNMALTWANPDTDHEASFSQTITSQTIVAKTFTLG